MVVTSYEMLKAYVHDRAYGPEVIYITSHIAWPAVDTDTNGNGLRVIRRLSIIGRDDACGGSTPGCILDARFSGRHFKVDVKLSPDRCTNLSCFDAEQVVLFQNLTFANGSVSGQGASLWINYSNILTRFDHVYFMDNSVTKDEYNDNGLGGAVSAFYPVILSPHGVEPPRGRVLFTSCTFRNNAAENSGGAVSAYRVDVEFHKCTLHNNSAIEYAGAVHIDMAEASFTATTFRENKCVERPKLFNLHVRIRLSMYWAFAFIDRNCSFLGRPLSDSNPYGVGEDPAETKPDRSIGSAEITIHHAVSDVNTLVALLHQPSLDLDFRSPDVVYITSPHMYYTASDASLSEGIVIRDPVRIVGDCGNPKCIIQGTFDIVQAYPARHFKIFIGYADSDKPDREWNGCKNCIVQFDSLILQGGTALTMGSDTQADDGDGGSVLVEHMRGDGTYVHFKDVTFKGNRAGHDGGAVYATDASARFESCLFEGNVAGDYGGAISIVRALGMFDQTVNFSFCTFDNNEATNRGGAVAVDYSYDTTFSHCTFSNNRIQSEQNVGQSYNFQCYGNPGSPSNVNLSSPTFVNDYPQSGEGSTTSVPASDFETGWNGVRKYASGGSHLCDISATNVTVRGSAGSRRRALSDECCLCSPPPRPPPPPRDQTKETVQSKFPLVSAIGSLASTFAAATAATSQQTSIAPGVASGLRNFVEMVLLDYVTVRNLPRAYHEQAPKVPWAEITGATDSSACERWPIRDSDTAMHTLKLRSMRIAVAHAVATMLSFGFGLLRRLPPFLHPERINCLVCFVTMPLATHAGAAALLSGDALCTALGLVLLLYGSLPVVWSWWYRHDLDSAQGAYIVDVNVQQIKDMPRGERLLSRDVPILLAHFTMRKGYWNNDMPLVRRKIQFLDSARKGKLHMAVVMLGLKFASYFLFGVFAIPCRCDTGAFACTTLQPILLLLVHGAQVVLTCCTSTIDSPLDLYSESFQSLGWIAILAAGLVWNAVRSTGWALSLAHLALAMYANQMLVMLITLCVLAMVAMVLLMEGTGAKRVQATLPFADYAEEQQTSLLMSSTLTELAVLDTNEVRNPLVGYDNDLTNSLEQMGSRRSVSGSVSIGVVNPLAVPSNAQHYSSTDEPLYDLLWSTNDGESLSGGRTGPARDGEGALIMAEDVATAVADGRSELAMLEVLVNDLDVAGTSDACQHLLSQISEAKVALTAAEEQMAVLAHEGMEHRALPVARGQRVNSVNTLDFAALLRSVRKRLMNVHQSATATTAHLSTADRGRLLAEILRVRSRLRSTGRRRLGDAVSVAASRMRAATLRASGAGAPGPGAASDA